MKKMKLICLFMLTLMMLSLCACGRNKKNSTSDDYITLTVWEDNKNIEMVSKMCDEFAKYYRSLYPKATPLKFNFIPKSEKSSVEDLALAGPAGNGPDILAFVHDTLGIAVEADLLATNNNAAKLALEQTAEALSAATYNDKVYGYPITSESQILIYRKSFLTSSDVDNVETIVNKTKLVWDVVEGYYGFGLFTDAVLYGEDGKTTTGTNYVKLDNPQTIANILAAYNLKSNQNLIVPGVYSETTDNEGLAYFQSGDAKAIIVAPYFWAEAKETYGDDVAMAVLPKINNNQLRPISGYKLYGVSKYSQNPAIAQMLADYLVSEECQAIRLRDRNLLPTNNNLLDQVQTSTTDIKVYNWRQTENAMITIPKANVEQAKIFMESLNNSITMPSLTRFSSFWLNYADQIKSIWNSSNPTEADVISKLVKLANQIK